MEPVGVEPLNTLKARKHGMENEWPQRGGWRRQLKFEVEVEGAVEA